MKNHILLFIGLALFFGIAVQKAKAQATATAHAFAEIIAALTATETAQLNFGKFSPEVQGGQVIVSPDLRELAPEPEGRFVPESPAEGREQKDSRKVLL